MFFEMMDDDMIVLKKIIGLFKKRKRHSITIGKARSVLVSGNLVSYGHARNGPRLLLHHGSRWKRARKTISIDPRKEPNPHIIIVGMSGYGKSTLFKSMLLDIKSMGIAAIVFDAHNEHERLVKALNGKVHDASRSGINVLELNGLSVQERIAELVSMFKSVYGLGHIQATKLSQCLYYTYRKKGTGNAAPDIGDLIGELSIFIRNAKGAAELNTLMHLREKISLLRSAAFMRNPVSIEGLSTGISSFSLAGLKSSEARIIYIHELLKRIYLSMKGNERELGLRIFMMIDEAQFLLGAQREFSTIRSIVEEGRKYGAGVIIATHVTANLDKQILANASTLISFYPRDPSEISYVSSAMSGSNPTERDLVRGKLRSLRQNEAMVVSGLMKAPVVVETPAARRISETIERMGAAKSDADNDWLSKLATPTDYDTAERDIGHEAMSALVEKGAVETMEHNGKTYVMKKNPSKSIEHELHVREISKRLSELGIRHYVMNNSMGPDVVAYINGKKTAVEYETGRKSTQSTARMLASRAKEYGSVIVFVNARAAKFYKDTFGSDAVAVFSADEIANAFVV
jgi:hypothetical protein